ncbi:MAG: glycosyltransferase family 2 protein [Edaphocola sp.]
MPVPISICIVTNRIDKLLLEIVQLCLENGHEVLVGIEKSEWGKTPKGPAARWVPLDWQGYGATKNRLAEMAANDWILSLDGDEMPDAPMLASLKNASELDKETVYGFGRLSYLEGKAIRHGAWGNDKVWRLYHRKCSRWDLEKVHEQIMAKGRQLLPGVLLHRTADTLKDYRLKTDRYATLSAQKYFANDKKAPAWKPVLSGTFAWFKSYVLQAGWLDGKGGWQLALNEARYSYLKYKKLRALYASGCAASNS